MADEINIMKKYLTKITVMVSVLIFAVNAFALEQVTYYHNDYLGSPVLLSNDLGQTITNEGYQPFGKRLYNEALSKDNEQWFTGRSQDPDTGLVYMNARYYHPGLGRFMAIDPVGFNADNSQSFNRYLYVNNNPYKYVDPDGEFLFLIPAVIWAVGAGLTAYDTYTAYEEGGLTGAGKSLGKDLIITAATGGIGKIGTKILNKTYKTYKKYKNGGNAGGEAGERTAKTCCFVAGTKVLTIDGYKNIEEIELGELVYSKDENTGEQDWKPVVTLFEKYRVIYQLDVVSQSGEAEEIFTTDDHPFYVIGKGFVGTIELNVGDLIETESGGWVSVQSVVNTERQERTYNVEVQDFHTYYVTELGIWAHNVDCGDGVAKKSDISTGRTEPKNFKEQLAMEEVKSKPSGSTPPRMPKMSDTKNNLLHKDGWIKRTQNVEGVQIHFVENINTGEFVDFKFVD